ncbi:MAG TPA: MoaD/ThiS family protein [Pseudomonadales bacterium]|nr:MoaD/ThiS family protein [Pseudomonadales bacterium]
MSVLEVRYFASLREFVGAEREQVVVTDGGVTLPELLDHLRVVHGDDLVDRLTGPGVRIAVNDTLQEGAPALLRPGDVVAFLPPVTGG